ncbi:hypothetical protein GOODEAATRI_015069 [Goodea atripinnis]|uniref:Secreted protein n=1 Tax=Goodea atripinnis TaxID=208336 RepID=A0ABV0P4E0_9TELE
MHKTKKRISLTGLASAEWVVLDLLPHLALAFIDLRMVLGAPPGFAADRTGPNQMQCKSRVTVNKALNDTTRGEAEQHGAAAADTRDDLRSKDTTWCHFI